MAVRTPGIQQRSQFHRDWGNYATAADLPNAVANPIGSPEFDKLEEGDRAYVPGVQQAFVCVDVGTNAGGDAIWAATGPGDHQGPKYIVGNALNGDSIAVCDFLDPGDGSGIAAALAAAALVPGDVYLRPGIYDFDTGAVVLPLTVPSNTSLRGPAVGFPVVSGGTTPQGGVLIRSSTLSRATLLLESAASIRQIGFELVDPAVGATGTAFIDATNASLAFIDQSSVFITAVQANAANESLTRLILGPFVSVNEVALSTPSGTYQPGQAGATPLIAIEAGEGPISQVGIQGPDQGLIVSGSDVPITNCQIGVVRVGAEVTGPNVRIDNLNMDGISDLGLALRAGANQAMIGSLLIDGNGVDASTGLLVEAGADGALVRGLRVSTFTTGVDLGGAENIVLGYDIRGNTTNLVETGLNNELGHGFE